MDGQDPRNKGSRGQLMPAASPRVKRVKSGREKKKSKGEREGGEAARAGRLESAIKASTELISRYYKRWRCAKTSVHPLLSWRSRLAAKPLSSRRGSAAALALPPFKVSCPSPPRPCWPPRCSICRTTHGARCYLSIVDYTHDVMAMAIGVQCELHIFEVLEYYFQSYI
jgi:hypothetical protein